jgi:hypothetical protein
VYFAYHSTGSLKNHEIFLLYYCRLWARNVPIISRKEAALHLGYNAAHYKHVRALSLDGEGVSDAQADNNHAISSFDNDAV